MNIMYSIVGFSFILLSCGIQKFELPSELKEISGIEQISGDLFVSINDSGDEPYLYFLNSKGVIKHKMYVAGAKNIDWEDITYDGKHLYVGDFGNNLNNRRDLALYKIDIDTTIKTGYEGVDYGERLRDTARAIRYNYKYPDQENYPPSKDQMNFDSEAITFARGSFLILTKSRTKPFKPISKIYNCTIEEDQLELTLPVEIELKGNSWIGGSVTGCDFKEDKLYVLTYRHIYIFRWSDFKFNLEHKMRIGRLQQWEAICVGEDNQIYIATEKSQLGKQKLRIIKKSD